MSPSGKVVVLFKAETDDRPDEYVRLFRENHLEAFCLSPIKFEFKDLDALAQKLSDSFRSAYSCLVITSPRVLQILGRLIEDQQLTIDCLRSVPCLTVGPQTFRRLASEFGITGLVDNERHNLNNAKELANYLRAHQSELAQLMDLDKPLLYPTSDLSKDELQSQLSETAFRTEKLICYETLPNDRLNEQLHSLLQKASGGRPYAVDAVERDFLFVFFSPSGVRSAQQTVQCLDLRRIKLIAIGPTTRQSIEEQRLNLLATAPRPTPDCLLATVLGCLNSTAN